MSEIYPGYNAELAELAIKQLTVTTERLTRHLSELGAYEDNGELRIDLEKYHREYKKRVAQDNKRLLEENGRLRGQNNDLQAENTRLVEARRKVEAAVRAGFEREDQLREAVRQYGKHLEGCGAIDPPGADDVCTCGLAVLTEGSNAIPAN